LLALWKQFVHLEFHLRIRVSPRHGRQRW
jgi:hypothetical protein